MKDPRKKNKHKLSYAVKNNLYLLRLASQDSRKRVVWEFVNEACSYVAWMFSSVVLLEYLVDAIEQKWDFKIVAAMVFLMIKTVSIDSFSICFAFIPIFSTYILGKKINYLKYDLYQESIEAERKRSYVSRTVYLRDYAKEIRLSNIFDVLMQYFRDAMQEIYDLYKKYGLKIELIAGVQGIFTQIIIFVGSIVYAAVRFLYFKDITAGEFVVLINIIDNLAVMIRRYSNTISKIHDNSLYIENVKSFLEYEPEISESQLGLAPTKEPLSLKLKNVSFSYFGQDKPVLKSISMHIEEKEKIALVGYNGAGKATLTKLLMRLYDVTEGEIWLGGKNVKEFGIEEYREYFGAVFQDYQLFAGTVAENVKMGIVEEEDRETIKKALEKAGFSEKLTSLEKQEDTVVFVSHRLSTTRIADRIIMFENGEIIEEGSYDQLMELNGKYAEMFLLQAEKYREGAG